VSANNFFVYVDRRDEYSCIGQHCSLSIKAVDNWHILPAQVNKVVPYRRVYNYTVARQLSGICVTWPFVKLLRATDEWPIKLRIIAINRHEDV